MSTSIMIPKDIVNASSRKDRSGMTASRPKLTASVTPAAADLDAGALSDVVSELETAQGDLEAQSQACEDAANAANWRIAVSDPVGC